MYKLDQLIICYPEKDKYNRELFLVKNEDNGRFIKLGSREIRYLFDVHDTDYKTFIEDEIEEIDDNLKGILYDKFEEWGFLKGQKQTKIVNKENPDKLKKIVLFEFDADKIIKLVSPIYKMFYSKSGLILLLLMITFFVINAIVGITELAKGNVSTTAGISFGLKDVTITVILMLLNSLFHELGHAFVCRKYGGNVKKIGMLLYYLAPAFFCDVSEVYMLKSRKERGMVAAAGILANVFVAFLLLDVYLIFPNNEISFFLLSGGMLLGLSIYNLIPFLKFDGYWLLQAITGIDNLMEKSYFVLYLCIFRHKELTKINRSKFCKFNMALYGFVCLIFSEVFWVMIMISYSSYVNFNVYLDLIVKGILFVIIIIDAVNMIRNLKRIATKDYDRIITLI